MEKNTVKYIETPEPLPWYVLILVGHALSGFFSWLLVIRQMYHRREKVFALVLFFVNVIILSAYAFASISAKLPWDLLLSFIIASNLVWAVGAWVFQRYYIGAAPKRYRWLEWRNWISPILIALVLSAGLAVMFAVFPVIGERLDILYGNDILDKRVVLWDFFVYVPFFVPYGLLVGFWWAGEGYRFSVPHVISYLSGLMVFFVILMVIYQLFLFLLFKGQPYQGLLDAPLLAHDMTGLQAFLQGMQEYDQLAFVLAPLLLGSVSSIREFWRRSLVIFPVLCLCLLPLSFYSAEVWAFAQGHIMHEMTSPETQVSNKAFSRAGILLARYPEHDRWPEFGLLLARHRYENSDYDGAKKIYEEIATRFMDTPRWSFAGDLARSVLNSNGFGTEKKGEDIALPLVNHESYLTPNWMALLQLIRYWSDESISESEILIRLKSLSKSDEKIKLSSITTLAELDDRAGSLGFKVLILHANQDIARSLLNSSIPVILPVYKYFYLLNGIDESRSLFRGYAYSKISERLREGDKNAVKEILFLEQEGKGESLKQLKHIAAQASIEIHDTFWGSALQIDSAPFMAVVYPESAADKIAEALPGSIDELQRQSKGYLAAFIAMHFLDAADPVQSIKWAMISRQLTKEPFGLHIAFLAERLWKTRDKLTTSQLSLDGQFPELAEVAEFFAVDSTKSFLQEAEQQFEADQAADKLSWIIRNEYSDFLDSSNPAELALLINLSKQNVVANPGHRRAWLSLAELYEWQGDVESIISALEGALAANSWNDEIALMLAYRYVQADRKESVEEIMAMIDPAQADLNPHYIFCQGALANWDEDKGEAAAYYAKAIEMRRYIPLYHLHYGELLLREGRTEEARKVLQWAIQVDVERGRVRKAAESLLKAI